MATTTATNAANNATTNAANNAARNAKSWLHRMLRPGAPPQAAQVSRDQPRLDVPKKADAPRAIAPHVHQFDASGWGHMVLVDSDGNGVIQVGDVTLTDCVKVAAGTWVDASRDFCLFTIRRNAGRTDLAICRRDDPSGGSILVHDWSPARSLGIRLDEPAGA